MHDARRTLVGYRAECMGPWKQSRSWIMASFIHTATTTMMMVMMMMMMMMSVMIIEAYHYGTPVDNHPEICESMSPMSGHHVEAKSSPAPFVIRSLTTSNCYKAGQPVTGEPTVPAANSAFVCRNFTK